MDEARPGLALFVIGLTSALTDLLSVYVGLLAETSTFPSGAVLPHAKVGLWEDRQLFAAPQVFGESIWTTTL